MNAVITAPLQRLHQLSWQAGEWMDEGWWQALSLTPWQHCYQRYPASRGRLNHLIARRCRETLSPLPASLSAQQLQLLSLEEQLPRLCTALGLLAIACPDYLLLGEYRRQLSLSLGERGCDQLLVLGSFTTPPLGMLTAEQLPAAAQARGIGWLRSAAQQCPVIAALQMVLPPAEVASEPQLGSPVPWLLRIGRFL